MDATRKRGLTAAEQASAIELIVKLWNRTTHTEENLDALVDMLTPFSWPIAQASLREAWQAEHWSPNPAKIKDIANRRTQWARDHAQGQARAVVAMREEKRDPILERAESAVRRMTPAAIRSRVERLIRDGRLSGADAKGAMLHPWAMKAVVILDEADRIRSNSMQLQPA
jgi:hypothetical protein